MPTSANASKSGEETTNSTKNGTMRNLFFEIEFSIAKLNAVPRNHSFWEVTLIILSSEINPNLYRWLSRKGIANLKVFKFPHNL